MLKWSYGATSVVSRSDGLLPRTLASLAAGGFDDPIVFMDGGKTYTNGVRFVGRTVPLGAFGNFVLAAWELFLRQPDADRYAIFQDDLICYKNLRQYLETCAYPKNGYCNLYTWPCNVKESIKGWSLSDQWGRGAVALMFDNDALRMLFRSQHFADHRKDCHTGHKAIDRAIIESAKEQNYREFVHNPSLVQHTGHQLSTLKNKGTELSPVFNGEDFDAMSMVSVK